MDIIGEMGSLSHWGLIMATGNEANSDNLGKCFRFSTQYEVILMKTHNIQFHDK